MMGGIDGGPSEGKQRRRDKCGRTKKSESFCEHWHREHVFVLMKERAVEFRLSPPLYY